MEEILKTLYYDASTGLSSKAKFKLKLKTLGYKISNKQVDEFLNKQELTQVNTKNQFKGFYKIIAPPRFFQIDIFFVRNQALLFLWK
jgi:hypothetical protein